MTQLTIKEIIREAKVSKNSGKAYTSLRFKAREYGDKWIGGFGNKSNQNWKEGDTVVVEVVPRGEYLNFEMKPQAPQSAPTSGLEARIARLEAKVFPPKVPGTDIEYPRESEEEVAF